MRSDTRQPSLLDFVQGAKVDISGGISVGDLRKFAARGTNARPIYPKNLELYIMDL